MIDISLLLRLILYSLVKAQVGAQDGPVHTDIRFIKRDYVEFLRLWHPIRDYVNISLDDVEL